ncbi:MAG: zinc-binding dehydrogenase [Actinomycetia bacterium]|nr:zinc-binding dehydrogenase [Actinomycetes bacterium]MCP4084878.1 zinc-binding dehydrogenase [Actinomycetes bacterium]
MRAAVMRNREIVVDEIEAPEPEAGQVLVKTLACGICGSDLHALRHLDHMIEIQKRTNPLASTMSPEADVVMGHEFCAEVIEFGPETKAEIDTGSRVVSMPVIFDPSGIKSVGYSPTHPGGYGQYMVLAEGLLLPVPDDLSTPMAALTEPMAVGRHAVEKANLGDDDIPLVVGCGPVGLAVVAALRQKGAHPVIAADFSPRRRDLALAMGADEVIDPAVDSPYDHWQDLAWPEGTDPTDPLLRLSGVEPRPGVIFECVGVPGVIQQIFDQSRRNTRVVVVGVCMGPDTIEPLVAIGKELNVQFVLGYTASEFADTLRGLASGDIPAEPIITGTVGIDGVAQAFTDLGDPEAHAKIMVDPWL